MVRSEIIDHSRRRFFHAVGFVAGAVPFVSAAYGFAEERFRYQIREIKIPVANFPHALDGLRITQLSDIHIGSYMPVSQVRRAVGMANELGGDLTVVTGDFLTTRGDPLEDCITELSRLRAPLGVWGCNGNHEIYAGVEARAAAAVPSIWNEAAAPGKRRDSLERKRVQSNRRGLPAPARHRGKSRADAGRHGIAGSRATSRIFCFRTIQIPSRAPRKWVSSCPSRDTRMAARCASKSSITAGTPASFSRRMWPGLYQRPLHSSSQLSDQEISALSRRQFNRSAASSIYVNRGLGTIGAPVRLGVPPEITQITLRRA